MHDVGAEPGLAAEPSGRRLRRILVLSVLSLIGVVLLYVPGPDYYSPRLVREVWAMGHLGLFCLLAITLSTWLAPRWRGAIGWFVVWALLGLILLGGATELLQGLTSYRDPSYSDWWVDGWGAALGLSISPSVRLRMPRWWRSKLPLMALPGVALCLLPLGITVADDWNAQRQFPVLSSLETGLEMTRWSGDAGFRRSERRATDGHWSLEIDLKPGRYSGVSLRHFPGDWRGYRLLHMDLWVPLSRDLVLRVNDLQHDLGEQRFTDRFNRRLTLHPGWNTVDIPLTDIAHAPATRTMNMAEIRDIGLFAMNVKKPQTLYLDNLRLLR